MLRNVTQLALIDVQNGGLLYFLVLFLIIELTLHIYLEYKDQKRLLDYNGVLIQPSTATATNLFEVVMTMNSIKVI